MVITTTTGILVLNYSIMDIMVINSGITVINTGILVITTNGILVINTGIMVITTGFFIFNTGIMVINYSTIDFNTGITEFNTGILVINIGNMTVRINTGTIVPIRSGTGTSGTMVNNTVVADIRMMARLVIRSRTIRITGNRLNFINTFTYGHSCTFLSLL